MNRKITTVVVTYNSAAAELDQNLSQLTQHVHIVICDNSTDEGARAAIRDLCTLRKIEYLQMEGNRGIACAQNCGFIRAQTRESDFVLLLDDDSRITPEAVQRLVSNYEWLESQGKKVGAVSARPIDVHVETKHESTLQCQQIELRRDIMSSGSLISMRCLIDVGPMDEGLFVDYVDFDWGWRALALGYGLYISDVYFQHALGEGVTRKIGIELKLKTPVRHYFQTRNALLLMRRKHVPLRWKLKQLIATPAKIVLFSALVRPRMARLLSAGRGIVDGLSGKLSSTPVERARLFSKAEPFEGVSQHAARWSAPEPNGKNPK